MLLRRCSEKGYLKIFNLRPQDVADAKRLEQVTANLAVIPSYFADFTALDPYSGVLLDAGCLPHWDALWDFPVRPLDLRIESSRGTPSSLAAWEWLQTVTIEELAWVIHYCGEDIDSLVGLDIATTVMQRQAQTGPFRSTEAFTNVVAEARGKSADSNLPKRVCEAIRVWLNQEIEQLELTLESIFNKLEFQGRCAILCYKDREACVVRHFLRRHEEPTPALYTNKSLDERCDLYPLLKSNSMLCFKLL